MIEIKYVGNMAGAMFRSYQFPRNEWVSVPEAVAMRFADSADFEIGDPNTTISNSGEEE